MDLPAWPVAGEECAGGWLLPRQRSATKPPAAVDERRPCLESAGEAPDTARRAGSGAFPANSSASIANIGGLAMFVDGSVHASGRRHPRRMTQTSLVTPVFLYDGDCAFCSSCARFIERWLHPPLTIEPWQFADLAQWGVTPQAAEDAVQWIDEQGVLAGPVAIAKLLRASRWYWRPLGVALATPPALWLAWPAYRWVSQNRHRLPGGTAACSLPQAQRDRLRAAER